MAGADALHHSRVEIANPGGRKRWVLYASHHEPVRLVVFVHGLNGRAVNTWNRFSSSGETGDWWRASDMLFVGYESVSESPAESAAWIRDRLRRFYPVLAPRYLGKPHALVRAPTGKPYDELVLVGHSLGGVILRMVLLQQARIWLDALRSDPTTSPSPLLEAKLRLFSPASAGYHPTGVLTLLDSLLSRVTVAVKASPTISSLTKPSDLLTNLRAETEMLVERYDRQLSAMRANILWARPERVVERDGYKTDYEPESLIPNRGHTQVCKPREGYEEPRLFVQTGRHR